MTQQVTTGDVMASDRYRDLLAEAQAEIGDGTGTLATVVTQALVDDPQATVEDVVAIWREATDDAAREA